MSSTRSARYLLDLGIGTSRVTIVDKGIEDPVASNDSEDGRALNKRVEVVINASEDYRKALEEWHGQS